MLPTSLAIAWPLWRRHRLGLLMLVSYLICAVALAWALTTAAVDSETISFILGPITLALIGPAFILVAVFSFGYDADLNARESCFPANLFRLPVRTGALVAWLMVYGAAAIVLLWLITALFILRPWLDLWSIEVPLWWPAALGVATLACFQALLWAPVGLAGFRIILATLLIPGLIAVAQINVERGASEGFLVGLFTGFAAIAWTAAYIGVKYARRGDTPDWAFLVRPVRRLLQARSGRGRKARLPFVSAARAQAWFEWRRTGLTLPFLTGIVLPFVLLPLVFGKNDVIPVSQTLLSALAIPVFVAGLAGTTVSGSHPWVKDYYGVSPFTATLPLSTAALVCAKLKAAALSTLAGWVVLAVMMFGAVLLTGNQEELAALWRQAAREHHPVKITIGLAAATALLIVWTWTRLVGSLLLGLTGRKWLMLVCLFAGITGAVTLAAIAGWIYKHPETRATALTVLPWLLCLWALGRLLAAGWALRQLLRRALVQACTIRRWLTAWALLGLAFFGTLAWVIPHELVPVHYLAFAVLLALPMAHLAATPLALAWNRHR